MKGAAVPAVIPCVPSVAEAVVDGGDSVAAISGLEPKVKPALAPFVAAEELWGSSFAGGFSVWLAEGAGCPKAKMLPPARDCRLSGRLLHSSSFYAAFTVVFGTLSK